jgi:hypothetical protein
VTTTRRPPDAPAFDGDPRRPVHEVDARANAASAAGEDALADTPASGDASGAGSRPSFDTRHAQGLRAADVGHDATTPADIAGAPTRAPIDAAVGLSEAPAPGAFAPTEAPTPLDAADPSPDVLRTADPEVVERVEKIRAALERLRPIPDGGVAVDVEVEGLGRVELRVEPVDGGLRVSLGTDEPSALARLEGHRAEIEVALRGHGEALALDIHAHGRRARTPRRRVAQHQGEQAPRRTHSVADSPMTSRPGRGLVDVIA